MSLRGRLARLRRRPAEDRLVALVADLESTGSAAHLRDALRQALADPMLDVLYTSVGSGGWLDDLGRASSSPALSDRQVLTPIEREGRPIAALVHDRDLLQRPDRLRAAVAATNLALDSLRLKATLRARLEETQASRARIVEASERERQRVERDLHDGAQQRLVGLALTLRLAVRRAEGDPAVTDLLDEAARELDEAIRELRELARGLHPAMVHDAGLAGALETLAERPGVPVDLDLELPPGLPRRVEIGAYYLVAEALTNASKHADAQQAVVRATVVDEVLRISVSDDGRGGAVPSLRSGLEGLADRVSALGGGLVVHSPPGGGTTLSADIPLGRQPVSDAERRRLIAMRWIGWESWQAPGELYDQITDEDNLIDQKLVLLCAGGAARLTEREREWHVGYLTAAGVADWVIEAIIAYDDTDAIEDLVRVPSMANVLHGVLYEALRVCTSDGPLTPDEVARLQHGAEALGLTREYFDELSEIVASDNRRRLRRYQLIVEPVLSGSGSTPPFPMVRELDVAALVASLVSERTVDIITRGRRSGLARTTEIWTTLVDGTLYVCGTPAAGPDGMAAEPRDWLANLLVTPTFTLRLKRPVVVDLPAIATPVTDRAERLRLFQAPQSRYYRDHSLAADQFVAHAPVVRVQLMDEAAPVSAALRADRANGSS